MTKRPREEIRSEIFMKQWFKKHNIDPEIIDFIYINRSTTAEETSDMYVFEFELLDTQDIVFVEIQEFKINRNLHQLKKFRYWLNDNSGLSSINSVVYDDLPYTGKKVVDGIKDDVKSLYNFLCEILSLPKIE